MSYICPVCNGLQAIDMACPVCAHPVADCGKLDDYLGPYSPYKEIGAYSMVDGAQNEPYLCIHLVNCTICAHNFTVQLD
ncbi:hypothetical protein GK047_21030 [Paenibacillus sp. SYP-B3998]|uniref:Uncharacterized protein n=1 Tax=Paenibacillus sp. SYP-B3998 TaxID=2678564 RepID=A0A6G4A279_9BACL|nr:hypothetical protein [Paenibacillus sp. SYP-B3998]NEW08485.1 hypothetical protein [Paenibacillus sp. SYP-B3998]